MWSMTLSYDASEEKQLCLKLDNNPLIQDWYDSSGHLRIAIVDILEMLNLDNVFPV